jgi:hypothetical protein
MLDGDSLIQVMPHLWSDAVKFDNPQHNLQSARPLQLEGDISAHTCGNRP